MKIDQIILYPSEKVSVLVEYRGTSRLNAEEREKLSKSIYEAILNKKEISHFSEDDVASITVSQVSS